jgi:lysyl-tRNA synthetase class 2
MTQRTWVPLTAAWLTRAGGVLDLVSAVTHPDPGRLATVTEFVPAPIAHAAAAGTSVIGAVLLLLGHGLARRKRRAWFAAVGLIAASILLHLGKGLDIEEAVASAVLLVLLLLAHGEFTAQGDPRTRWAALRTGPLLLIGSTLVGFALIQVRLDTEVGTHPLRAQLAHVLLGLFGISGPLNFRSDADADVVSFTLGGLGALTVLATLYLTLRPAEPIARLDASDEHDLRALLDRYGGQDSLGYFALRRDKSVLWSPSRKAAITYRVVSGVALAGGDPLGDPEAWPGAITALLELCQRHAWVPAVMGCSEAGGKAYSRCGLSVLELGDEAVLLVDGFSTEGRAMRGVRQSVARIERAGYTAQVRRLAQIPPDEREDLDRAAAAWRGAQTERGFSMALGRFGDPADDACVLVTAAKDGQLRALLHFVPWGPDGLSLDLMRRDREGDNGLNEFLIVAAARAAPMLGVRRLSLNFAVFRQALERGDRLGAGPLVRTWRDLLVFASRWVQIDSLYRFNAKFGPEWEPRYVCYPASRDLPRVAVAALEAEAFLAWPSWPGRRSSQVIHSRSVSTSEPESGYGESVGVGREQG